MMNQIYGLFLENLTATDIEAEACDEDYTENELIEMFYESGEEDDT